MTQSHPRPDGLDGDGGQLWDDVTSRYTLRVDELMVLKHACREVNLTDKLEAEIETVSFIVTGGYEQDVANPLIVEIRQHRALVARMLGQLKLPDELAADKPSASEAGRRAVNARWGNTS